MHGVHDRFDHVFFISYMPLIVVFTFAENSVPPQKYIRWKFDLIISIQTLYYLNNKDLNERLISLNKILKKNGMVFFTMMSTKNSYFKSFSNKKIDKSGMTLVNVSKDKGYSKRQNLINHSHYINFTKNENELVEKFKIFKKLAVGSYDLKLESLTRSEHHFTFLGRKRS